MFISSYSTYLITEIIQSHQVIPKQNVKRVINCHLTEREIKRPYTALCVIIKVDINICICVTADYFDIGIKYRSMKDNMKEFKGRAAKHIFNQIFEPSCFTKRKKK